MKKRHIGTPRPLAGETESLVRFCTDQWKKQIINASSADKALISPSEIIIDDENRRYITVKIIGQFFDVVKTKQQSNLEQVALKKVDIIDRFPPEKRHDAEKELGRLASSRILFEAQFSAMTMYRIVPGYEDRLKIYLQ